MKVRYRSIKGASTASVFPDPVGETTMSIVTPEDRRNALLLYRA